MTQTSCLTRRYDICTLQKRLFQCTKNELSLFNVKKGKTIMLQWNAADKMYTHVHLLHIMVNYCTLIVP